MIIVELCDTEYDPTQPPHLSDKQTGAQRYGLCSDCHTARDKGELRWALGLEKTQFSALVTCFPQTLKQEKSSEKNVFLKYFWHNLILFVA